MIADCRCLLGTWTRAPRRVRAAPLFAIESGLARYGCWSSPDNRSLMVAVSFVVESTRVQTRASGLFIRARSGLIFSCVMGTSCPIEKPQSSGRSVTSQNAPTFWAVRYTPNKRQCRASGLVPEPEAGIGQLNLLSMPISESSRSARLHQFPIPADILKTLSRAARASIIATNELDLSRVKLEARHSIMARPEPN